MQEVRENARRAGVVCGVAVRTAGVAGRVELVIRCLVGVEGTGSYGAGLARHLAAAGVRVVEVGRSDRQDRRRQGKSDPLDAVSAARAAQSGRARGAPKGRDGPVEAIRALMAAKRTARSERAQTINQARSLVLTGPDDLRVRFTGHTVGALVAELAALRPRPGDIVGYATRIALRELGRRAEFPGGQLERLDELIVPLVTARAPGLLALHGAGPGNAALLLATAGDHPGRLRPQAAWAHLCAAAPIPASSGRVTRHRLNPGGDRQANHALWRIVITRMSSHPPTRAHVERRSKEGLPKKEIIRCLKRYVAREVTAAVLPHEHRRGHSLEGIAPAPLYPPRLILEPSNPDVRVHPVSQPVTVLRPPRSTESLRSVAVNGSGGTASWFGVLPASFEPAGTLRLQDRRLGSGLPV